MKKTLSKKRIIILFVILLTAATILFIVFLWGHDSIFTAVPAVTIETPDKKSFSDYEPFALKLELTMLGEEIYPAASFCIGFDSARLEFLGIEEGNVLVTDLQSSSGYKMPEWNVDVKRSNEIGQINLMYLDMTGGKNAFTKEGLREEENIILYLRFRLRGSAQKGDIYELTFEDAVFATSDESKSLASSKDTLKTNNGRIVIGG